MKDNGIAVSCCLITYNHEDYIEDCLKGMIDQIFEHPFEIIIGDDCSSDKTSDICRKYMNLYPKIIKYKRRERNIGMNMNWIKSIQECSGKYIALCEGDDYWVDNKKIHKQFKILENNPNYIICHHWHKFSALKNGAWMEFEAPISNDGYLRRETGTLKNIFENKLRIKTRTMFFRNIFVPNFFPEWFKNVSFVDVPITFLLGNYGNFYFIDESMSVYRQTETGVSKSGLSILGRPKFNVQHYKNWIEIWDYADCHYDYKYHDKASKTIDYFYIRIINNLPIRFGSIIQILKYNFFIRKTSKLRATRNGIFIIQYFFKSFLKRLYSRIN
ncbi:glycosyltransferase [Lutimonas saemankumensis]|uniref:glycosyltransferase family 2 protein n=1 Tax=Lutimonas saemankumensis TaxID=483016 RepID=UPI001CD59A4F|nr:glycosyltransferase [Lutimonas saemankumensis]MCA0931590.1 glycosyltransferase [Lutimonas saemankumensis]